MENITQILEKLCSSAYWYGEETGDYDMKLISEKDFFKNALRELGNSKEE